MAAEEAGSLVKLLALSLGHSGHGLHREQVANALWPGLDERSRSDNLHRVLHHFARRLLEAIPANVRVLAGPQSGAA